MVKKDREVRWSIGDPQAALHCHDCDCSLLLPGVSQQSVEDAASLGRERGSDMFSKVMMSTYKEDPTKKLAITTFLLCHIGHSVSPAMIVETVAGGSA